MKDATPLVFDIKRHALDDGPGIRTTIFLKGCPLRCIWCHNPESVDPRLQIGFYPNECIGCGDCVEACPNGAARMDLPGRIDRGKCRRCGTCVDACPGKGLRRIGRFYEIEDLVEIILRDRAYYETSGGGVTLSGGEPTLHMSYTAQLLRELKANGINTAIETCGFFDWRRFETEMLDWIDLILFDIKLADAQAHQQYTGKSNEVILKNLAKLITKCPEKILPRIPLIPKISATPENVAAVNSILAQMGARRCAILHYNPLGTIKQQSIGEPAVNLSGEFLTRDEIARIKRSFTGLELIEV